jgi:glycosyltransferase involved in cell wall biosynthesis
MTYRLGFVMEQTLGHITHAENFKYWVDRDPEVKAHWIPINYDERDKWDHTPLVKDNWTLKASLRARDQVRSAFRTESLDGLFFHTQVTALFSQHLMMKVPTVVSMDATPLNFDAIGQSYNHTPSPHRLVEAVKNALNGRTFEKARRLITWNEWGKQSLMRDYGIPADKVIVIPPGINMERWQVHQHVEHSAGGAVRLLFVGGDFRRKGGETLLKAFCEFLKDDCELDIVTREDVDTRGLPNVRVHSGLRPNSAELMKLYERADVFVFPTLGDSLPLVIMEAMASGLPVITTAVGAIAEEVEDGVTGFLTPPEDHRALANATLKLVRDVELRRQMGAVARRAANRLFNGSCNYHRVLAVCKGVVDASRRHPPTSPPHA